MRKSQYISILALLVLSSCDPSVEYKKFLDNERITWNRFDVKSFSFEIKDISASYDFYIALRHHTSVPFNQITTELTIYTPSGETRTMKQKIMIRDREGNLLGNGMGDLWDIEYPARMGLQFTEPGTCRVEIASTMSQADLPGIMQVGLIVKKER